MNTELSKKITFKMVEVGTDKVLATKTIKVEYWMDEVDAASEITEKALQWCSDNGYAYEDEVYVEHN